MKTVSDNDKRIKMTEDFFREQFESGNFPMNYFTAEINTVSVDFVREAAKYIDIKKALWNARPWNIEQTIEQHMNYWHGHLKEFWKDMLSDEEYIENHPVPIKGKTLTSKTIKEILDWIQ